jgi:hypothetical protein
LKTVNICGFWVGFWINEQREISGKPPKFDRFNLVNHQNKTDTHHMSFLS